MTSIEALYQHQLSEVLRWQKKANDLHLENLKLQELVQEYRELVLLNPLNTLPESVFSQAEKWYAKARALEQRALERSASSPWHTTLLENKDIIAGNWTPSIEITE